MNPGISRSKIEQLQKKGIVVYCPESTYIGEEVPLDQISGDGVVIHSGCKIFGSNTLIMAGCEIGYEGPVTIENCQLGPNVKLHGGFFSQSTFLADVTIGSGAHIRAGCLLEEGVKCGHTVGLKQTILFPFVTLGSLINFCDCFMSGGTSKKNHSEVGSSYIHFNYTPDQDKATPSLIGDVPKGVMLNQKPIFLGGQGGLVGPIRIGYGTIISAGTIYRKDFLKGDSILFAKPMLNKHLPFHPGLYPGIKRIIVNNINYLANIIALKRWYVDVRALFFKSNPLEKILYDGALKRIEMIFDERIKRLKEVADKMPKSLEACNGIAEGRASKKQQDLKREFYEKWTLMEEFLRNCHKKTGDAEKRAEFLEIIHKSINKEGRGNYLGIIEKMKNDGITSSMQWLQGLVDEVNHEAMKFMPSLTP